MKNAGKQYMRTSFRNGGRKAGMGMRYDDYSEESGNTYGEKRRPSVRFPLDNINPQDLNGEVIIVQKGRKKNATD